MLILYNLLNVLKKRDKIARPVEFFYLFFSTSFIKFNKTGARMLDSYDIKIFEIILLA